MELRFDNKTVLVTGASRGIGRAVALAFAAAGARVAVHYAHDNIAARDTLAGLPGTGHAVFQADLRDPAACATLFDRLAGQMHGLDVLVNNAGIYEPRAVMEQTYAEWQTNWRRALELNLTAAANLCFLAAQAMRQHGGGRIVNVSSRGAFRGEPEAPAYGASKAGLNALSQSLAQALAPFDIFVGVVAPGFVRTDMTADILDSAAGDAIRAQSPLNRVATPEEVARAVLFLAAPGTEFTTGTIIDVNGASYLRT